MFPGGRPTNASPDVLAAASRRQGWTCTPDPGKTISTTFIEIKLRIFSLKNCNRLIVVLGKEIPGFFKNHEVHHWVVKLLSKAKYLE